MQPDRRQPTRLPCPWDSAGKNTGVGCHFLLQCMKVKSESEVAQSCPTLRDPMDCSLPRLLCPWDFPGKCARVPSPSPLSPHAAAAAKLLQSCLTLCDPRDLQKAHSFYSDISWWSITGVIFFYIQICLLNRWNRCLNANGCPLLSCSLLALLFLGYTKHLCSFTFLFATGFLSKKWNLLGIF